MKLDKIRKFYNRNRPVLTPVRHALFLAIFIMIYSAIAASWTYQPPAYQLFFLEIPLLTLMILTFSVRVKYKRWYTKVFLAAPYLLLITAYIYFDVFFMILARVPRFSDVQNIPSLFKLWDLSLVIALCLPLLLLSGLTAVNLWHYTRRVSVVKAYNRIVIRIVAVSLIATLFFQPHLMAGYVESVLDFENWSESCSAQKNGRLSSMYYYQILRDHQISLLESRQYCYDRLIDESCELKDKRNVHIVLLESLFDPSKLTNLKFNKSPIHPSLNKYLNNGEYLYTESSVYGGSTAQSEFEVLCGAPALAKVGTIEFNSLRGEKTYSLCKILGENGFESFCSCTTVPGIYNSDRAYASLQFDHVLYKGEENSYLISPPDDESWFYDGALFKQNLEFLDTKPAGNKPYLNYIMSIYGHTPHGRDKKLRPDVLFPTHADSGDSASDMITDACNQCYYRTHELSLFLDKMMEQDPDSIIILFSDHMPPIDNGSLEYFGSKDGNWKKVPYLMFDRGELVTAPADSLYDLHYLVLHSLGAEKDLLKPSDELLTERYYSIIAAANGLRKEVVNKIKLVKAVLVDLKVAL